MLPRGAYPLRGEAISNAYSRETSKTLCDCFSAKLKVVVFETVYAGHSFSLFLCSYRAGEKSCEGVYPFKNSMIGCSSNGDDGRI